MAGTVTYIYAYCICSKEVSYLQILHPGTYVSYYKNLISLIILYTIYCPCSYVHGLYAWSFILCIIFMHYQIVLYFQVIPTIHSH